MYINEENSIIELNSYKVWNTTTIMVWVHGNELSWVNAMLDILKDIKVISWKVYVIFANLKALEINKRFYEKDLNRCFIKNNIWKTYEDKRANEIIPYLEKSNYLLDIHNTLNEKNSIPFLISEHKNLWKYFDVNYVISWFDKLHPGWSDGYTNSIWKIGLCLEVWNLFDIKWQKIAKTGILNFLAFTWNIYWISKINESQNFINFNYIYKNKTMDFRFSKPFLDFEKVNEWDIICYDGWKTIEAPYDSYILFSNIPNKIWNETFCLGKSSNSI